MDTHGGLLYSIIWLTSPNTIGGRSSVEHKGAILTNLLKHACIIHVFNPDPANIFCPEDWSAYCVWNIYSIAIQNNYITKATL